MSAKIVVLLLPEDGDYHLEYTADLGEEGPPGEATALEWGLDGTFTVRPPEGGTLNWRRFYVQHESDGDAQMPSPAPSAPRRAKKTPSPA